MSPRKNMSTVGNLSKISIMRIRTLENRCLTENVFCIYILLRMSFLCSEEEYLVGN